MLTPAKRYDGFTLIEMTVTMVIFLLFITVAMSLFKYQVVFSNRIEQESEMQDNLRMAAYWLNKDIKEASSIVQLGDGVLNDGKGPGPGRDHAFKLYFSSTDTTISYYYRNSSKTINVLYRDKGESYQPVSNEYIFNGVNKGYITRWNIEFKKANGDTATAPEDVSLIEFTIYGSYPDKNNPDLEVPMRTTVKMRIKQTS